MFWKINNQFGSLFLALFFINLLSYGGIVSAVDEPIYIGVLLPLSGTEGLPLLDALHLCVEQINEGGGIGGHPIELILRDTRTGDLNTYATELAEDPRIRVVIGPYTSDNLFQISNHFMKNQKVLISPTASSDEIYRAFAGTGAIWRTIANDGDITSIVMQQIKDHHAKNVALLTVNSTYGETFYDWIPYWALENGINITGSEKYSDPNQIPEAIHRLCVQNPDYLIFIHSGSSNEISSAIHTLENDTCSTHLYLIYPNVDKQGVIRERADSGTLQGLLNSGLWKLKNTSITSTKLPDNTLILMTKPWDSDFYQEFTKLSKTPQTDYVPETYDALLVSAEVMARFIANPNKSPKNAAMSVLINGTGDPLPRTKEGFQSAFDQIQAGKIPVMMGATGLLTFVREGTDRQIPWYETYRIEGGGILPDPITDQRKTKSDSESGIQNTPDPPSLINQNISSGNFWAVIGAFSRDWKNYRHQADALTVYQLLKRRGVADDHIILLVYDDIPEDKRNSKPDEVYHTPNEEEVRKHANPDYIEDQVNKKMLLDVLSGTGINQDEPLLQSDENSTVLVYIASHAASGGDLLFGDENERISPEEFTSVMNKMADEKKFGHMLVILESCFSGATAANITTPGVVVLTASAPEETSKAAIYDSELSTWLSDEFTAQLISLLQISDPSLTLRYLYQQLYYHVRSSHPGITRNDNLLDIPADIFFGGK
jgi:ABC-type branched-subunit amino acid transport system substrate-binding protein